MNQQYLRLYADFIVKVGVNVRPRQNFIVRCPVTMPDFAHACVRAGYEAGAKQVIVRWKFNLHPVYILIPLKSSLPALILCLIALVFCIHIKIQCL